MITSLTIALIVVILGLIIGRKMVLADIIRKFMPIRLRQEGVTWIVYIIMRWRIVYVVFYWVLFGIWLKEKVRVEGDVCFIEYKGKEIIMSRDGIMSFLEVFYDEVYDVYDRPQPGEVVFDVGACVGLYSIKANKAVGVTGLVVAIEPSIINFRHLWTNLNTYDLNDTIVLRVAAAAHNGLETLYLTRSNFCHSLVYLSDKQVMVKTNKLDNIAKQLELDQVDLIKIDAEGAELEVLKGSHRLLCQDNIRLVIAAYHDLPNGSAEMPHLVSYLKSYGFDIKVHRGQYIYAKKEKK